MRTGFLVSYKRTLPIIYIWLGSFLFACYLTGVLNIALLDFEVYVSWILWPAIVALNKNMIIGFQNLFDIFTEDDLKYSMNPSFSGGSSISTTTQNQTRDMFTKDGYDEFINNVKGLVFNPRQKYLIFIGAGFYIPVLTVVYSFFLSFDMLIYDVPAPEILGGLYLLSFVYIFIALIGIISMAWLLYSIMASVHQIRTPQLRIAKTIPLIRDPTGSKNHELMGYNEFRVRITLLGQYLYNITLRITGILVLLVMGDILRNWLYGFDWGIERFIIGGILVIATSIVVYISQMGIHSLLSKSKDEFIIALQKRKFKMDIEIQCDLDLSLEGQDSVDYSSLDLSLEGQDSFDYSSARYDAINRLDTLLEEIQSTSTWAIKSVNTVKVFSVSIVPLIASILPLIVERLFF